MKEQIFKYILEIREIFSNDFLYNNLQKNSILFNKCYASFDLLEDTEYAIDYYKNSNFDEKDLGEKYIIIYGLFEAFYIQFDAIEKIRDTMIELLQDEQFISKVDFNNEFDNLKKIKEYRNDIVGHPAYRNKFKYSVYMSQHSLSKDSIEYIKSNTQELKTINIIEGIKMQETSILNILNKIFDKLKIKEEEHYTKYKDEKLHAVFMKDYIYPREKIFNNDMIELSLDLLKSLSDEIKKKLNERYINYYELDLSYLINDIDNIIVFIEDKLQSFDVDSKYRNFIRKNMIENLINKFDELMKIFTEIDKKYEDYFNPRVENKNISLPEIEIVGMAEAEF